VSGRRFTGESAARSKTNGTSYRRPTKDARAIAADTTRSAVALTSTKPRRSSKLDDSETSPHRLVAETAVRAASALASSWPRLPYATIRSITIHAVYLEMARASGMQVPLTGLVLEPYAGAGLDAFLDIIGALPFAELTPEHFGAAHETLTGYHSEDGRLVSNDGRRRGGVHFTPRSLTEPIVSKTLEPLLAVVPPERTLELRVCDPSVGAGAFLLELVRQLGARAYEAGFASSLNEAKRLVAIHCAYGVDICRFGVAATKLALTLECRADRMPSDWLDDNVKCGDALVGLLNDQIARFHWSSDGKDKTGRELPRHPELSDIIERAMVDGVARRKSRIETLSLSAREGA